jgi:hypothetical protein
MLIENIATGELRYTERTIVPGGWSISTFDVGSPETLQNIITVEMTEKQFIILQSLTEEQPIYGDRRTLLVERIIGRLGMIFS